MSRTVKLLCQACHASIEIPYTLIGATTKCPTCGTVTVPEVPIGTRYPHSGYEITFQDFEQLLDNKAYRPSIRKLLRLWYGYKIHAEDQNVQIRSREGNKIDRLVLHNRIQADAMKQQQIYRVSMSLWR